MNLLTLLRKHWYDLGGVLAVGVGIYVIADFSHLSPYQFLMWISLMTLFLHQLEEYRVIGTFPGMMNSVMFKSPTPDRYPLNTNTSLIINVVVGWGAYFLAALFGEHTVWLGMAAIFVSAGNTIAHLFLFNIRGKTLYNAGMATAILLFLPCVIFFFVIIHTQHMVSLTDYLIGVPVGLLLNIVGILKLIEWLAKKDSPYVFENRNLLVKDRSTHSELPRRNQ